MAPLSRRRTRSVASSSSKPNRSTRPRTSRARVRTSICRMATWKCVSSKWSGRRGLVLAEDIGATLEQRFRAGHGRIVAALTRRFGLERIGQVENAVQEAYLRALERWPAEGVPDEPERWLVRVAHNALVDSVRRDAPLQPLGPDDDVRIDPP